MTSTLAKRLADWLSDLAVRLTPELPSTETLPLYADWTPSAADARFWKPRAGYYLVRTSNGPESQWLTGFALWLQNAQMGSTEVPVPLLRANVRSAYTAFTPNGRPYTRVRTERTWHNSGQFGTLPETESALQAPATPSYDILAVLPELLASERTVAA